MINRFLLILAVGYSLMSCVTVKEYQKVNINDPDMSLTQKKLDRNVNTMYSYREAAVGANGGKTGGGCGCN
ncbi:DUF4266 domain-containing protein [Pseudozobellia sp. WGM2]|uniref:DUF4266 domain-containing protein n=1 Tax=Pseudozobellia sp. WGM2 TaxID=2787625 RepID=UPI001ADEC610|nr:DUF4266 domain-containing protein [Pseudozobellia sp. WGM2]